MQEEKEREIYEKKKWAERAPKEDGKDKFETEWVFFKKCLNMTKRDLWLKWKKGHQEKK